MSDSKVRKLPLEESKRTLFIGDFSITAVLDRKYRDRKVERATFTSAPRDGKKN